MTLLRRPPKMMPDTCTPAGSSADSSSAGLLCIAAVKRLLGWAALRPEAGVHFWLIQSIASLGGSSVLPSHHTSPSGKSATFV